MLSVVGKMKEEGKPRGKLQGADDRCVVMWIELSPVDPRTYSHFSYMGHV